MSNHVHLLVTPMVPDAIGKMIQSIGRRYVYHFNRAYGRTGTLWEGRYKATLVQDDVYALACYRYIELNPLRAGLVEHPAQYPHSSYRHNALGTADFLIFAHEVYLALADTPLGRREAYRHLFDDVLDEATVEEIRRATQACRVLGGDEAGSD
jgi:putative transposase